MDSLIGDLLDVRHLAADRSARPSNSQRWWTRAARSYRRRAAHRAHTCRPTCTGSGPPAAHGRCSRTCSPTRRATLQTPPPSGSPDRQGPWLPCDRAGASRRASRPTFSKYTAAGDRRHRRRAGSDLQGPSRPRAASGPRAAASASARRSPSRSHVAEAGSAGAGPQSRRGRSTGRGAASWWATTTRRPALVLTRWQRPATPRWSPATTELSRIFRAEKPRLVLLDLMLPRTDRRRADADRSGARRVPVIAHSGCAADHPAGVEAGRDDFSWSSVWTELTA